MSLFFSNKAVRLLLSVSVSIWIAGGCLIGCTTDAIGVESGQKNVVATSCHAMPSHDGLANCITGQRGMMKDCPLAVNATAATSKSSAHMPEPGREPVHALAAFDKLVLHTEYSRTVPFLYNRGSTHLQCCVFLI